MDVERKKKIEASFITKQYELAPSRVEKLQATFFSRKFPVFWAVRGVSFTAYEGETIAVVGTNGSGKSTLMKMVAGIIPNTTGKIDIHGDTSLIAINAGLRGGMTGRENIKLKGLMVGLTDEEILERMDDIIAFSELGDFIDQQVKHYSSGMKSKLGFAISVYTNPDIVIIDEALSVGDATFNRKSLAKIKDFQKEGKTIFFVSHDLGQVREMADKVLWMHFGEVRMFGPTVEVMNEYDKFVSEYKALDDAGQKKYRENKREAQMNFSVDGLAENAVASAETPEEKVLIKKVVYEQPFNDRLSWGDKIGLGILLGIAVFLIGLLIMQGPIYADVVPNNVTMLEHGGPMQ
ncbi:ABC transporter ATP-binding protein [Weissella tructae]|uniref:Teichoic acids export ATP-binding protein TagH n=2 Tax=Weissella TaxID=46255 RepID=A0A075TZI3_9LACO|nr:MULTISPECIES: ABC transporter ATP-binding protein [Weissella]AIG65720.1 Teichoic acids export ATP-binding protein TagH [Weissella tructae]AIM63036.1 Teichoic acids export ATP-binding protein TagH [Weissella ceti]AIM64435.1 Teichoic acids export ATP-binding protein TagH [Weissella ceti]ELA06827.1 ABC transporter ATP-binding protein [Weissella ceti NC36]QVV90886.1 ABC transporter ATP-binding protein [Weissella tructae]